MKRKAKWWTVVGIWSNTDDDEVAVHHARGVKPGSAVAALLKRLDEGFTVVAVFKGRLTDQARA